MAPISDSASTTSTLYDDRRDNLTWSDSEKGLRDEVDTFDGSSINTVVGEEEDDETKKQPSTARCVGALVGGCMAIAATGGTENAVGLMQRYWEDHQLKHYSPRDVGWIAGTSICLSLFLPVVAGPIFDRYGPFWILVVGTASFSAGIFAVSFLDESVDEHLCFSMLVLSWGILCGMGNGLINTATSGVVCQIFDKRRALAAGVVSGGNSIGGIIWPMLLRETLDRWGWRWSIKLLAGLTFILLLAGIVLVRTPPPEPKDEEKPGKEKLRKTTALKICVQEGAACFKKGTFVWMTLSLAIAQFVVMGIMGTLPSWGDEQGFDTDMLFNLVAIMNASSGVGRLLVGAAGDYLGRYNSIILTMIASIVTIFGLFFNIHHTSWRFYVFSALWGFMYGAILSMMNVLIREVCRPEDFGRHMSASYSLISIAGLLCVPLSAQILGSFGPQIHVIFFGSLCALSTVFMVITRWGLMGYKWIWIGRV